MTYQRLRVLEQDGIHVVHFNERQLIDLLTIEGVGQEMYRLSSDPQCMGLLVNFAGVEGLSTSMLGKLIMVNKRMMARGGKLVLCEIKPQLREVFTLASLDRILTIRDTETAALSVLES
jgi:anti-sigma B factor antagonist